MSENIKAFTEKPNTYPEVKWREYLRIKQSFDFYDLAEDDRQTMLEALHSDRWDWFRDCDGCSCVSEPGWPSKYFPPCVLHDYRWHTGEALMKSNREFRRFNRLYRMEGWRSSVRWFGVTVATPFAKFRNWIFGTPEKRKKKLGEGS